MCDRRERLVVRTVAGRVVAVIAIDKISFGGILQYVHDDRVGSASIAAVAHGKFEK